MARGGARPGAGRKAGKSANTSPVSRGRAHAREDSWLAPDGARQLVVMWRNIERLIPYARNARTHSDAQIAQIAGSIREFGFTNPVLIDEKGGLIAGHGRVLGARQLGMTQVPTITLTGLTETQRRAYVIADNKLALNAGWDPELLRLELGELKLSGFDLSLTGFGDLELKDIMADRTEGLTDPDDAPEAPEHPVSQTGDLWLLGRHRLLCGDSTVATDVERVLDGVEPHLMVTDPPYGVEYDPLWRERTVNRFGDGKAVARGDVRNDDRADWREAWALFPGNIAYVWHGGLHSGEVEASLVDVGFVLRAQIIWAKQNFALSRGDYHWMHEPCWYAVRKSAIGHWAGDRKQTTLWHINSINPVGGGGKGVDAKVGHGTQKPVECMRRPIENNSSPGQAVYEPFCGSGTTIIAAAMTGRMAIAIELSPAYVDVGVKRWQDFTGEAAVLDGDGRTFDQIAAALQLGVKRVDRTT
jgi:DNA modification methylase